VSNATGQRRLSAREVISLLRSTSWRHRQRAQEMIAEAESAEFVRELVRLSGAEGEPLRVAVCRGLGRKSANLPLLKPFLEDESERVRSEAEWLFQKYATPEKVETLIELLGSKHSYARAFAATALGNSRAPVAVKPLIDTLDDPNGAVREKAAWALKQLAPPGLPRLMERLLEDEEAKVRFAALVGLGSSKKYRKWRRLQKLLDDRSVSVRLAAAWAIGRLGGRRAAGVLARALAEQEDPRVRCEAGRALRQLATKETVAPLLEASASDSDQNVRLVSGWAVDQIPEKAKLSVLLERARSSDPRMRMLVCAKLGSVGAEEALAELKRILATDESSQVRAVAAEALGEKGDRGAIPALVAALQSDPLVSYSAVVSLMKLWDPRDAGSLIGLLERESGASSVLQQVILKRLGELPLGSALQREAVTLLISKLSHDNINVRYLAAGALGEIASFDALIPLVRVSCHDPDENVRAFALDSIERTIDGNPLILLRYALESSRPPIGETFRVLSRVRIDAKYLEQTVTRCLRAWEKFGEARCGRDLRKLLFSIARMDPEILLEVLDDTASVDSRLLLLDCIEEFCRKESYKPAVVKGLLDLVRNPNGALRAAALRVLAFAGDDSVLETLVERAVREPDENAREAARSAVTIFLG